MARNPSAGTAGESTVPEDTVGPTIADAPVADPPVNEPAPEDVQEQSMSVLRAEAKKRELNITGTGEDGAIVKDDLVRMIAAHDALIEPEGRPPLIEVARAAVERDEKHGLDMRDPATQ